MYKSIFIASIFLFSLTCIHAQQKAIHIQDAKEKKYSKTDSLIVLYQNNEHYTLKKIIRRTKQDSLYYLDCFSGKSLLILAVFKDKPINEKGELAIYQKTKKATIKQSFSFEELNYNEAVGVYTSAVKVMYPSEANSNNCYSKISMFNEDHLNNSVYFIVFTK